ncbi:MAG: Translation elongation factor P Lys34:lysine transferase [Candidatus Magasanikbacteria bacterium GW2011_GWC2_37_14]|uniref:Translation elongation factor P Lys34:lysine transferase n=1 Tax=Candidatus Magasanikbacteria bacterium GW2011_GWC2_37_14 TaxID=1619046 RepID=A0A0G0GAC2_9BACT|nr:MAG: Translation elongation factor P Lys34:lysine transferase [Candidatus Magasanikbacteria bacterium GW2011_GWC2_37_14]
MNQLSHLQKNKQNLELRFAILKAIRGFFSAENFVEVEVPLIVKLPGQEPNLSPIKVNIHNERGEEFNGFLHTSPEYTMKKLLAVGWEKIFYLGKTFRDQESFGGTHNPEFTMCEWYRTNEDMFKLMDDLENLFNFVAGTVQSNKSFKFQRITMKELWQKYVGVNLDEYLSEDKMFELCVTQGYQPQKQESYEELFYRIFLNKIEANLIEPTIVYNYPAKMASLSKLSAADPNYAERFEVYINGLELANAFSELTNGKEQLKRLKLEQAERGQSGKDVFDIDEDFIEALNFMPASAGIALGVDRLVMLLASCQEINNVITLPMSKIF